MKPRENIMQLTVAVLPLNETEVFISFSDMRILCEIVGHEISTREPIVVERKRTRGYKELPI